MPPNENLPAPSGSLGRFETLDDELPLDDVRALVVRNASDLSFVEENLAFALRNDEVDLAAALREAVNRYRSGLRSAVNPGDAVARRIAQLESRLTAVEDDLERSGREVRRLTNLLPVRLWTRFARWRRRTPRPSS